MTEPQARDDGGERTESSGPPAASAPETPRAPHGGMGDRELVAAMRRDDVAAFTEFVRRHHRLLVRYARRVTRDETEADVLAMEVIEDAVLRLLDDRSAGPRDVRAYLTRAFRTRYLNAVRDARTRERLMRSAAAFPDPELGGEVVAGVCSEGTLRASGVARGQGAAVRESVARLGAVLDAALGDDDRRLLAWVSEHVPQRLIGEWLGVSPVAARQRLNRLRQRMRGVADRYIAGLGEGERKEVEAVLRRTGTAPWEAVPPGSPGARRGRGRRRSAGPQEERGDD